MAFKHAFTSVKADGGDATLVKPSDWNADHTGSLILNRSMTRVDVDNTVTETSIYSSTISAGELGVDGGFRLALGGGYLNNSGSDRSLTVRLKLGAHTEASRTFSMLTQANPREWYLSLVVLNLTATTQWWSGHYIMGAAAGGNFIVTDSIDDPTEVPLAAISFASSVDTGPAVVLDVTVQHSVALATVTLDKRLALLELLPKS